MTDGRRLAYEPALDGVRAVAVVAVLCFHGGFAWAQGGFLGVSVFFTLSGFLITSLLLAEHDATGTIALRAFWGRRLRRLLPASLVCLAGVAVLVAVEVLPRTATFRGDLLAALADVANWRFYASGQAYGQLFQRPSPLQHFWSLAIEEQFYVVFPLLVWVLVVKLRRSRALLAAVLGLLWLGSFVSSMVLGPNDPDLVYQATFTRAAELLTGSLAALAVAGLAARRAAAPAVVAGSGPTRGAEWADRIGALAGAGALGGVAAATYAVRQSDTWLYEGGLALFSLLSVALVLGARRASPVRSLLALPPLVWVGRVSYGLYLYHWPVFLVLDAQRTGLDRVPLFGVRIAVTVALAAVSFAVIEQPVRHGRLVRGPKAWLSAPVSLATLAAGALVVPAGVSAGWAVAPPRPDIALVAVRDLGAPVTTAATTFAPAAATGAPPAAASGGASGEAAGAAEAAAPVTTGTAAPTTTTVASLGRPARVLLTGDSTANALAPGLVAWGAETGLAEVDPAGVKVGCGFVPDGRDKVGPKPRDLAGPCGDVLRNLERAAAASGADVALVVDGPWEVTDHQAPGDVWREPGDPVFDARMLAALGRATDILLEHVPLVVWTTSPVIHPGWGFATPDNAWEPERMAILNGLIRQLAAERPGRVIVVDYATWLDGQPAGMEADVRPDGVHLAPEAARWVSDWIGPQLVQAVVRSS